MYNINLFLKFCSEITAVLKGHTGLVKGVSWDPVGKYIASQVRNWDLFNFIQFYFKLYC